MLTLALWRGHCGVGVVALAFRSTELNACCPPMHRLTSPCDFWLRLTGKRFDVPGAEYRNRSKIIFRLLVSQHLNRYQGINLNLSLSPSRPRTGKCVDVLTRSTQGPEHPPRPRPSPSNACFRVLCCAVLCCAKQNKEVSVSGRYWKVREGEGVTFVFILYHTHRDRLFLEPALAVLGCLRRISVGLGFLVVCFLYKINPNPT